MKFVFVLVLLISTFWVTSQQFHLQRSGQPWWSQYRQPQIILQHNQPETSFYYHPVAENPPVFRYSKPKIHIRPTVIYSENDDVESNYQEYFDRKPYDNDPNSRDDELMNKNLFLFEQLLDRQSENKRLGIIMPVIAQSSRYVATIPNQMADVMPRNKNYGPVRDLSTKNQEQNARFFYFDGTNFLSKTVTISVTSTCTSLSIVSCIPLASLDPNAPPVNCRRKRSVEIDQIDQENTQFPVNPTKVQTVMPTVEPLPLFKSDSIQPPSTEMISSKEEETIDTGDSPLQIENQLRKGRVFKFNFQNFLTYTTITILKSIITSTLTQTYLPAAALACLPAGYALCPV